MYEYIAKMIKVIDGDTMDFEVDLGFKIKHVVRVRLDGIDTPEIYHPSCEAEKIHGREAAKHVVGNFLGKEGILITHKDKKGKYGRYIADFRCDNTSLVVSLVHYGFEKKETYEGGA